MGVEPDGTRCIAVGGATPGGGHRRRKRHAVPGIRGRGQRSGRAVPAAGGGAGGP